MRSLRLAREKWLQARDRYSSEVSRDQTKYRSFRATRQGSDLVDIKALESINAQREAFSLAFEVVDRLYFVAITSRGQDLPEIKDLMRHTDDLIQISHEIQTWLHNLFDGYSSAILSENYWEAVKAIEPLLAKHPILMKALPELDTLGGEETVKKSRHSNCGGYFHTLGRSKDHRLKYYHLCDRCGQGYWSLSL